MRVYTDNHLRPEPWMSEAECATTDVDMWFPEHGDQPTAEHAKRICRTTCPVREQCLEYAIRTKADGRHLGRSRPQAHSKSYPASFCRVETCGCHRRTE